jgi:hypothetical protein
MTALIVRAHAPTSSTKSITHHLHIPHQLASVKGNEESASIDYLRSGSSGVVTSLSTFATRKFPKSCAPS